MLKKKNALSLSVLCEDPLFIWHVSGISKKHRNTLPVPLKIVENTSILKYGIPHTITFYPNF